MRAAAGAGLFLLGACAHMGDRPPWWKVEPPEPVNPALECPFRAPSTPRALPRQTDSRAEKKATSIQRRVRARYPEFLQCYEVTLARDPVARGRVSTHFTIEPSGEVSSACVDSYTLADGKLLECTTDIFKSIRFEADVEVTSVVYPIFFEPAKGL